MPNIISEQHKKLASLYLCNELSITDKIKFEQVLQTNTELQNYVNELKSAIERTKVLRTIKPSEEFLEGNRNLLRGRIQMIDNEKSANSMFPSIFSNVKHSFISVAKARQPVWVVASYVLVGLLAGRLLFAPAQDNSPIDFSVSDKIDINELIQSGVLTDLKINQSAISPSSIKLVSHSDNRFNVTGNVNDQNIRQILYYLFLNDDDINNRYHAGELIKRITPSGESQQVLISSILSETDQKVKLLAMETLIQYQSSPDLINACKRILLDDPHSKIRFIALSFLENNMSSELVPLLQVVGTMDDDTLIRNKANVILAELQKSMAIQNVEVTQ